MNNPRVTFQFDIKLFLFAAKIHKASGCRVSPVFQRQINGVVEAVFCAAVIEIIGCWKNLFLFRLRIEIRRLEVEHSGGLEVETETESRDVLRQFELVDDGLLRAVENEFLVDAEMTVVELFVSSSFEYESNFGARGYLNS